MNDSFYILFHIRKNHPDKNGNCNIYFPILVLLFSRTFGLMWIRILNL